MRKRLKILDSKHSRGKSNEGESNDGDRGGGGGGGEENHNESSKNSDHSENATVLEVVNRFLSSVLSLRERHDRCPDPPEVPDSAVERLISTVKRDITRYESDRGGKWNFSLLDSIEKLSSLSFSLSNLSNRTNHSKAAQSASTAVQQAMSFLGEELQILLEDPSMTNFEKSSGRGECKPGEHAAQSDAAGEARPYPPGITEKLRRIVETMISAGYESECCQTFGAARRSAFHAMLSDVGFGKVGVNDVPKMAWESLEGEVATWTRAFRESVSVLLPRERGLCESVFSGHRAIAGSLFGNLARGVVVQLLNFAEAVATSNRSAEKLFKVLDMYETLRDMLPEMAGLFPGEEEASNLRSEISAARARLGEAAVLIFCELENSIKADTARSPVQGGAVHPLACHVMGYLEHACEYASSLQQVFDENLKGDDEGEASSSSSSSPFATELTVVMELLDSNIAAKSKLYKEPALSYIFLMNNGRYVAKKIKESGQIFGLLGNNWNRKRLTVLQEYHKNYRETWSKVLGCFREEGLHSKGMSVSTPALKERLKSFNAMIEEIRKTQSQWVVSDEQMQSELRVSISAVVVPAYRSFLGRYSQYVNSAKQAKYIKFTPEDIETYIDELFVGNHSNHHHGKKIKT